MIFKTSESINKVSNKSCFLGSLILTSRDGLKNLFFLGSKERNDDKYSVDFLLTRKLEEERKDSKLFYVNSDIYTSYSVKINVDIHIGEKIHFSEDLGYYIMNEIKGDVFKKDLNKTYEFQSVTSIKFMEIKKDEIIFDINFIEY